MNPSPGSPTVLVIGGGVTGTGIARDLAMRGADVTLVERDRLAEGTTGRMHGLLHSGARYSLSDPGSAKQCVRENAILREIASHCVEDTGGLLVSLTDDDPGYFDRKLEACDDLEIPTREVDPDAARRMEPELSADVDRAFLVADAAIDPFRLVAANAASAENHGATIVTGTEVVDFEVDGAVVTGAIMTEESGTRRTIDADHVVNAAGPWVADVLSEYVSDIPLTPAKGAMAVTNSRPVDTVINRCRPTDEGDILVPHETTAILGTTDRRIEDPDDFEETQDEVDLLVSEVGTMVPALEETRLIRTYWGVRPLFDPESAGKDTRDGGRDFAVLDHEERDGLGGVTTVLGGKLTTYRLMAERTADLVAEKLDIESGCRTAEEPLPGSRNEVDFERIMDEYDLTSPIADRSADRLGDRADDVLESAGRNPVVCECEGVTQAEIQDAIAASGPDLGAVRMRTRATMGTCQGGFCSHRLATLLSREYDVSTAWDELEALLEERWKGQQFVMTGDHLAQAALNRSIHHLAVNIPAGVGSRELPPLDSFDDGQTLTTESPESDRSNGGGPP